MAGRALRSRALIGLAVAAFVALAVFGVPFPVVVAASAAVGWALGRWVPTSVHLHGARPGGTDAGPPPLVPDDALHTERPSRRHAVRVVVLGLLAWAVPVGAVALVTGRDSVFTQQNLFFSGAALVTFGGAYAVLAYVAQQAVQVYGWLTPGEMVRGLALAESIPGPLIMVVQFKAFLGAYRQPGSLDPRTAAVLASLLVTWVTFVPCFVFIFLGAPYVERLRGNRSLSAALTGITAAVVGVIATLAVYFALHTLFDRTRMLGAEPGRLEIPELDSVQPLALLIAALAAYLLFGRGWTVLRTLGVCAAAGLLGGLVGGVVGLPGV